MIACVFLSCDCSVTEMAREITATSEMTTEAAVTVTAVDRAEIETATETIVIVTGGESPCAILLYFVQRVLLF